MMSSAYPILKHSHMLFVALSLAGFLIRLYWSFFKPMLMQLKLVKIFPHVIDTLLLASAIGLAIAINASPHNQPWLAGKILFLILYIGLGFIALKPRFSKPVRLIASAMALATFFSIAFMAFSKQGLW